MTYKDKLLHAVVGFAVGVNCFHPADGIIAATAAGAAAEYKDRAHGSRWDWYDLAATALGGTVGALLRWTFSGATFF